MDPYLWILLILSYCTSSIENFSQLSIILLRVCIALYQIMPICFCTEIVYYINSSFHCWIVCIFIVDFKTNSVRKYEYLVNCVVLSHWSRKTNNVVYTNLHHKIILKHKSNKLFYKPSLWEHRELWWNLFLLLTFRMVIEGNKFGVEDRDNKHYIVTW